MTDDTPDFRQNWWLRVESRTPVEVKPATVYSGTYGPGSSAERLRERLYLPPPSPLVAMMLLDFEEGGPIARAAWEATEAKRQAWLATLPRHGPPTREEWEELEKLDWEPVGDTGGIIYSIDLDEL